MEKFLRTLRFFRLTDSDDNLSLTNTAMLVTLVAMVVKPGVALTDTLALVAALTSYQAKRWLNQSAPEAGSETEDLKKMVAELQTKVTGLQLGQQMTRR